MREIKFRAWDKKTKKMYYLSEGKERGVDYQISFWLGGCELVEITAERGGVVICGKDDTITGTRDDGEFMQCTGLKDKNGKEIYEGDILKNDSDSLLNGVWKVLWDRNGWSIENDGFVARFGENNKNLEVIGNIYENSELLGGME